MRGFSLTHWGVKYSSKQEQNSELRTCTQLYNIYMYVQTRTVVHFVINLA